MSVFEIFGLMSATERNIGVPSAAPVPQAASPAAPAAWHPAHVAFRAAVTTARRSAARSPSRLALSAAFLDSGLAASGGRTDRHEAKLLRCVDTSAAPIPADSALTRYAWVLEPTIGTLPVLTARGRIGHGNSVLWG